MKRKLVLALAAFALITVSCTKDKALEPMPFDPDCPTEISYAAEVKPVIDMSCATSGCHDASGAGGYTFTSHAEVAANADVILNVINHDSGFAPMPQGADKLPDSTILKIKCWVQQGKLDN
jgi:hypothetical protein